VDGQSSPEGVRSISAGYGTIARMAAAAAEAEANAAAARGEAGGSLQRAHGGSADSGQRLQNLSFNTYGDLVRALDDRRFLTVRPRILDGRVSYPAQ